MARSSRSSAEFMKIRQYVLNFVAQSGGSSVRVPSIIELSQMFDVSRPTVSKAMKAIVEDGYVIIRPGIGAFTNPEKALFSQIQNYKKIGFLMGDGMMLFYGPYETELLAETAGIFAKHRFGTCFYQLTSHHEEEVYKDISKFDFSVLIWYARPKKFKNIVYKLRSEGRRIITVGGDDKDFEFDYEGFGYEVGKELIKEGRNKIVYLLDTPAWGVQMNGVRKAYKEAGIELAPDLDISSSENMWEKLEKLLSIPGKVDTIFSAVYPTSLFMPFYEKLSPDIKQKVRFIIEKDIEPPADFCGWLFQTPFAKMAKAVTDFAMHENPVVPKTPTKISIDLERKGK